MTEDPYVILVDEHDNQIGIMNKLEAHKKGLLHRAFSVFIFNINNQLLLQQRASSKYHSPNLWTNTCCSHPYPNESNLDAALRRLSEEMGLSAQLTHKGAILYKTEFENGLIEHEFDHIWVGRSNQTPILNTTEVQQFKWVTLNELKIDMKSNPDVYTFWFKAIYNQMNGFYDLLNEYE